MLRFIKFFIYSFAILFVIWGLLVLILTQFGLETKRFNPLIIEQVKKYNENLNLDIKKVKIHLNISQLTKPKLKIRIKDPVLTLGKNKIEIEQINSSIDVISYFKNDFLIESFGITTKNNRIKDFISIAALENPSLIIYNVFIKEGHAEAYGFVDFNEEGKITDYGFNGEVKNAKMEIYDISTDEGNLEDVFIDLTKN